MFALAVAGIKSIPEMISRLGVLGLAKRVYRVFRESGIRGLMVRVRGSYSYQTYTAMQHRMRSARQQFVRNTSTRDCDDQVAPKILYVINLHDVMTIQYRVRNYAEALAGDGITSRICLEHEVGPDSIRDANLLVLNRISWSAHLGRLIQQFREKGCPIVFDIDDFLIDPQQIDLLHFTRRMARGERHLMQVLMQRLEMTMRACDFVTVSTHALRCEVERRGLPAFILPNNNGVQALELAREIGRQRRRVSPDERVRIGYFSGTKTHEEDFAECAEGLCRVLEDYPRAELLIVGHLDVPERFGPLERRITRIPMMPHHDMLKELAAIDINVAPLALGNLFTDCKSELKIFESALFGIPTIASPTSTYAAVIEPGRSGFLAATPEEWYDGLSALIKDGQLRRRIGDTAQNVIAPRYAVTSVVHDAKAIYTAAVNGALRPLSGSSYAPQADTSTPLVTIVSVLYRKADEVRYFLEALRRNDCAGPFEVILVDDQSPDDSVRVVEEFMKRASIPDGRMTVRILHNTKNLGNCGSRNAAIKEAAGDVIIVVDADCMLNRTFLSSHLAAHAKGDCDVAIGPINIETLGEPPFSVLGRHEANRGLAEKEGHPQDAVNPDSFVNCITRNFSIRRAFLEQRLGGILFDEAFAYSADPQSGFGWEDVEMGFRIYAAGGRIKYLPDTVSIHVSHTSSADEREKPLRSLRNFRRLLEKHPDIVMASRQWTLHTYAAIVDWVRSVGHRIETNPDYQWLELHTRTYRHAPIIVDRGRKLRILTYRWHVAHQYELYKIGHEFTLVTGAGTALCDGWELDKRPMPRNARMISASTVDVHDYDLAVLHFDENVLRPDLCNGKVPGDWGQTFKWFLQHIDVPKVAICHGTPQFIGQYIQGYRGADLRQVLDRERESIVDMLGDIPVVCNSHQAQAEWGFRNSTTIWHGFSPHEYPDGSHEQGVVAMLDAALQNRPHYNGLYIYEDVRRILGDTVPLTCLKVPNPPEVYLKGSEEWAVAQYQNYTREIGRYAVYFNTTIRSPMPRGRGEAMMAGLVSVSLKNHDVELFIKNGINGFFADSSEELAEQLVWLSRHPVERARISRASRLTAMDLFNQDRYLAEWTQLLNEVIR